MDAAGAVATTGGGASNGAASSSGGTSSATSTITATPSTGSTQSTTTAKQAVPGAAADTGSPDAVAQQQDTRPRYKIKRGGKELELPGEDIAKQLSDDYEHEFRSVGGKPVKLKWQDIERAVQQSDGALQKMREAAEAKKRFEDDVAAGMKDIPAFVESRMGVEDYAEFVLSEARRVYNERAEIARMGQQYIEGPDGKLYQNPHYDLNQFSKRVQEAAAKKLERKTALEKARAEAETQSKQQAENAQRRESAIKATLQEAKISPNRLSMAIANEILDQHIAAQHPITPQDLVALTKRALYAEMHGQLDAMDDESLAEWLGDDRRSRLREIELKRAREKQNEAKREARAEAKESAAKVEGGISDKEFKKLYGIRS